MSGTFDVFVIGAGVSGLTVAEQAARRGLAVAITEELMFGGLVLNVNHLKPGLAGQPASGSELAANAMSRMSDSGVTMLFEQVTSLMPAADGAIEVTTTGATHSARCLVIASGARQRHLGVPGQHEFEHRGVSHCADCDAPMYKDQCVVVVGGGDSALQGALVLAGFCSEVHLVHRGGDFRARTEFVDAVREASRIRTHLGSVVDAVVGDRQVNGIQLRDLASGETRVLACTGFFAYVGLEPNIGFLPPSVETAEGAIWVNDHLETSVPNVFAIGAVRCGFPGQLTDAVADAAVVVDAIAVRVQQAK